MGGGARGPLASRAGGTLRADVLLERDLDGLDVRRVEGRLEELVREAQRGRADVDAAVDVDLGDGDEGGDSMTGDAGGFISCPFWL